MKNNEQNFVISEEDWSLHRKGFQDQTRHMEKVKEAIKNNLPDLITEENIIMSNGRDVIKIPIRSLDEYKIRYNYDKTKHVGQGDGGSKKGDVVARAPNKEDGDGSGKGEGEGGNQPGSDYYEAEVSLVELEEELFKELELPHLEEKDKENIIVDKIEFNDVRKKRTNGEY